MRIVSFIFSLLMMTHQYSAAQSVVVYTELSPPYQFINEKGDIAGEATDKVRLLLSEAGVNATFELYPWARSFKLATHSPNALLYSIAKIPEREDAFVWLAAVSEFKLALVSLTKNALRLVNPNLSELHNYSFAVQRDDVAHIWMMKKGLVEGKNMLVCADIQCSWEHLLRGTVDFIVEDPALFKDTANRFGVAPETLTAVKEIPELSITGYLAGNRYLSEDIVGRLKKAAQKQNLAVTFDDDF